MAEHGNSRLKIFGDAPEQEKLPNNRYRIIVRCDVADKTEDWYYANEDRIWREFGDLYSKGLPIDGVDYGWTPIDGEAYPNMALVAQEWKYLQGKSDGPVVEFIYETLTSTWTNEDDDTITSTANGLRVLTRTQVALPGTALPYDEDDVGVVTITDGGKTLYLAGFEDTGGAQIGRIVTRWNEAGQVRVSKRPGPPQLAGVTYVTITSEGVAVTPTGALIEDDEVNTEGYSTFIKTAIQGTITGTKQTYKDVIDVRLPGTVNLTTVSKSAGSITGTIAVPDVTPPRTKKIAAQVTVEITTTPPDTASLAYDLGDISCSVTSISMSENFRGTDVFTTASGNTRFSGERKTADMSARVSTYPECYLSGLTSASGTFAYTSSFENTSTSPNVLTTNALNSTTNTFVDGTGSTSDTSVTTGILRRSSRPIVTTIDGTTYYEVITWSV